MNAITFFTVFLLGLSISIYTFVLFVKLAHRGITALDLYIAEKTNQTGMQ